MSNNEEISDRAEWEFLEKWLRVNRWQRELAMQELELLKADGAAIPPDGGLVGLQNRQDSLIAIGKTLLARMEELARKDKELLAPLTRSLIRTELSNLLQEFGEEGRMKSSQNGYEYWIHASDSSTRGIKISVNERDRVVKVRAEKIPKPEEFSEIEIQDIREIPAKIDRLKHAIRAYLAKML